MQRLILLAALVAAGCDGTPPTEDDAGTIDAAIQDAAPVELCTRDSECDDGVFCNGPEACRPGDASSDARGCVAGASPCTSDCDEMTERCASCTVEEADRDGDGEASMACGGLDCDDADPLRYSAAIEVCDVFHVDEDCDLETLYNAGAVGAPGDRDGDGHVDAACGNIVGDTEAFGDDCDDRDASVSPSAPERCNGVDDDCDGSVDEDFECVQSTDVSGTNACGREAFRRCDDTCAFVEDGFYVAESAATCDYCDDSGSGLNEERPFSRSQTHDLCVATPSGSARVGDRGLGSCDHAGGSPAVVVDGAGTGALFLDPIQLGYGEVDVSLVVSAVSGGRGPADAALVLMRTPTRPVAGSVADLGIPGGLEGFAVTLRSTSELATLERLTGTGRVELVRQSAAELESRERPWTLSVRPDDPDTAEDETRIIAPMPCPASIACSVLCAGGAGFRLICDNSSPPDSGPCFERVPCGATLAPGEWLSIGVTAAADVSGGLIRLGNSPARFEDTCR